jgi:hypothetical protein
MIKKIILGVFCIIVTFLFTGCRWFMRGGPDYSKVFASVSEDYYEQFDVKGFTLESFNLTNAKDFEYRYLPVYDEELDVEIMGERFFLITLNKTGEQYAQAALDWLIQLEFIESVDFYYQCVYPGELLD